MALRTVPTYGPAELTADLNACSADWSSNNADIGFENTYGDAEVGIFESSLANQDSENDLFQTTEHQHRDSPIPSSPVLDNGEESCNQDEVENVSLSPSENDETASVQNPTTSSPPPPPPPYED
jgi:hypothetical protein